MQITGKCGLRDAQFLLRQPATKLFLIAYAPGGYQAEDLSVTKCLGSAHLYRLFNRLYIYTGTIYERQIIFAVFCIAYCCSGNWFIKVPGLKERRQVLEWGLYVWNL